MEKLEIELALNQFNYSNRLSSIHKWISILIGIWITIILSCLTLYLDGIKLVYLLSILVITMGDIYIFWIKIPRCMEKQGKIW